MNQETTSLTNDELLKVENLRTYFYTQDGISKAVDGVDFSIKRGRTLGMVGESGCGKSVTSLSILRLLPEPPARIEPGSHVYFEGEDLLSYTAAQMRKIRGNRISMIFQEPMTSLNPVFTVGDQIAEVYRVHRGMSKKQAMKEAVRMLEIVKIPNADKRVYDYPHQMSGGMRQRVMIAMALACDPALLIADEPTTALDVTVQAQILALMEELRMKFQSSVLMITHDLGIIAEVCDDVTIMYAGQIVESAPVVSLYEHPLHPYTKGLIKCIPNPDQIRKGQKLASIEGSVPNPTNFPEGCRFHPRCPYATAECKKAIPSLVQAAENQQVRCIYWDKI